MVRERKRATKKANAPLVIKGNDGSILNEYSPDLVDVIKSQICPKATDEEMIYFLQIANMYDLNPFTNEIYFVKVKTGDAMTVASRDGLLKLAGRNPNFKRISSHCVYDGDDFNVKITNGDVPEVSHSYGIDRGKLVGAYAFLESVNGLQDYYYFAPLSEYDKGTAVWKKYKSSMIQKCAEARCLKLFSKASGLTSVEELGIHNPSTMKEYQDCEEVLKDESEINKVNIIDNDSEFEEDKEFDIKEMIIDNEDVE